MAGAASRRAVLGCLLGMLAAAPARADPLPWQSMPESDPAAPIARFNAALLAVMREGRSTPFTQRYAELAPVVDRTFDLAAILRTSVGFGWAEIPAPLRARLLAVFRQFTIASYVANFDTYTGEQLRVLPNPRPVGPEWVVATEIVPPNGQSTRIDYVMHEVAGEWRAVDVLLDGTISRVAVQRSDFSSLIASRGGTGLIESLQQKVGQLSGGTLL
ncbi:MAG TPA: ABC transporter substrate-binding protein [Acetobacteraceae bacterium]|nr:ABC transporter substrate-binding protein [Acetobacteraceae bacterium]